MNDSVPVNNFINENEANNMKMEFYSGISNL